MPLLLLLVLGLVAGVVIPWRRHRPVRFPAHDAVDLDAAHAAARAVLDDPRARRPVHDADGVRVFRVVTPYSPYVGYLSVQVLRAEAERVRAFVHEGAPVHSINPAYEGGAILDARPDGRWPALVGTMRFASQSAGTAPRDGVAITSVRALDGDARGVLTLSVDHPAAPERPTHLRYRNAPSYDRVTPVGDGRVRVEHMMVLDPNGWILPWMWNLLFTLPNARIYAEEARRFRALVEGDTPTPDLHRLRSDADVATGSDTSAAPPPEPSP